MFTATFLTAALLAQVCAEGQAVTLDTAGHCCWPGQVWSRSRALCVGAPSSCPKGLRPQGDACVTDCPAGLTANEDTKGHCCWAGQVWSQSRALCVGVPQCPAGFAVAGEACVAVGPQQPGATQPYAAQPGVTPPYATQPYAAQPNAAQPFATQPYATQPSGTLSATQPNGTQPYATQPYATPPYTTQPNGTLSATQPNGPQPYATQPNGPQPYATQPNGTQPYAAQPSVTQPYGTQPYGTQPYATQPNATQPNATQPNATQPNAAQPNATQPYAAQTNEAPSQNSASPPTVSRQVAPPADPYPNYGRFDLRLDALGDFAVPPMIGLQLGFAWNIVRGTAGRFGIATSFGFLSHPVASFHTRTVLLPGGEVFGALRLGRGIAELMINAGLVAAGIFQYEQSLWLPKLHVGSSLFLALTKNGSGLSFGFDVYFLSGASFVPRLGFVF